MADTVFLKLGGSVLTDKAGDKLFHADRATRLASEISDALKQRPMRLVLGHGAGCFGHVPARQGRVREGLAGGGGWQGFCRTRQGVMELNALVVDAFAAGGLYPVFLQPSASALARGGALESWDTSVAERLLDAGQIPMVCGDAVVDVERGFTIISTEGFFARLARRLTPSRVIMACDVDGVFDADPKSRPGARRLDTVDARAWRLAPAALGGARGADVTGGMATKVAALAGIVCASPGAQGRIVSGLIPGRVRQALLAEDVGTRVAVNGNG
ncbi:MAG TPA: isopentenyl phosphate kinase [Candidatus Brocadiia bacterium]|nr:isopentenyl phosphate kinase [Candidatus Brocadiia bacterium]